MARHHATSNGNVAFTAQEEIEADASDLAWANGQAARDAQEALELLEAAITPRRIRDAFADPTWMNAQEALIAIERAKL